MEVLSTTIGYLQEIAKQIVGIYQAKMSDVKRYSFTQITGFSYNDLICLQEQINILSQDSYIFLNSTSTNQNHITEDELYSRIEEHSHFFLLIPSDREFNSKSFDIIKADVHISIKMIEESLIKRLIEEIPSLYKSFIQNDIIGCLQYLTKGEFSNCLLIRYLLTLKKIGYTAENIGNYIYILDLIPDSYLIADKPITTRNRLSNNRKSVLKLIQNDKTLYERISELQLETDSVQKFLVDLFRAEKNINTASELCHIIHEKYPQLNFANWAIEEDQSLQIALPDEHITPKYDLMVGTNSGTNQFGILGESMSGRKVAIDLSGTNTISLFGVQGAGKSYTIGTISEMVLKQFSSVSELPDPLAGVIFHYSESMDYEPEFTSMMYANTKKNEIQKLKERYGADPGSLDEVVILCPKDKVAEKRLEYPSVQIEPIAFNPRELNVQDWMFMLGAMGSDVNYVKQLKAIAKKYRKDISIDAIEKDVETSILFTEFEKGLALQKLDFAREYVDDSFDLGSLLRPGRLIIVDLRDEFIDKDEALGLFVVILNIFSAVKEVEGNRFNKFIVFDEAHKYMDNVKLTSTIVTAIREMRHKGVNIMIASQDPPSLPKEIIELSSVVILHKFNSPQWLDHIKYALTQLEIIAPQDMSVLSPGEAYLWATKATEKGITYKPLKISARPRITKHGGATLQAGGNE